jgi:hypothetical protein
MAELDPFATFQFDIDQIPFILYKNQKLSFISGTNLASVCAGTRV